MRWRRPVSPGWLGAVAVACVTFCGLSTERFRLIGLGPPQAICTEASNASTGNVIAESLADPDDVDPVKT